MSNREYAARSQSGGGLAPDALVSLGASDPEAVRALDELAQLAARLCRRSWVLLSLAHKDRVWRCGAHGFESVDSASSPALTAAVLRAGGTLQVQDLRASSEFCGLAEVRDAPSLRSFAGVALVSPTGASIGALCVLDPSASLLSDEELEGLRAVARRAVESIEMRANLRRLDDGQNLLRQMFDANPSPMWIHDEKSSRFLSVNDAAVELYGYSREALLGMTVGEIRMRRRPRTFTGSSPIGGSERAHLQHRTRTGLLLEVEERSHNLEFQGQRARLVMVTDVTSLTQAEEQLRQHAALLDAATDAIVVRTLADEVEYWNESAARLYEVPRSKALGQPMGSLVTRADPRAAVAWRTALSKGDWAGELTTQLLGGRELVTASRLTLVRDEHGSPRAVLQIDTDITDRKLLESQFLRAQRLESLGMLASGIAHDLNNVLQPIVMSIDLLRNPTDLELVREVAETLCVSARRGADMVNQVTMFSRGADGKKVPLHPKYVVKDLQRIVTESFPRSIACRLEVGADVGSVMADPTQLHQVLLNLCVNARDAMPDGGELTLTVENLELDEHYTSMVRGVKPGGYVVFSVRDTGSGIPAEIQDKIFEPFFTTKSLGTGTGLGLSTVMVIVRGHEGYVTFDSQVGRGTVFRVHIPRVRSREGGISIPPPPSTLPRGAGEWVLVVDDESNVRGITRHTLEAFGYHVLMASDGAEAVALFAQHRDKIAVVLMDMMMPVMDGPSAIRALKSISPELPVIAASGLASDTQRERVTRLGVREFLPKPYTAETLLRAVREALPSA